MKHFNARFKVSSGEPGKSPESQSPQTGPQGVSLRPLNPRPHSAGDKKHEDELAPTVESHNANAASIASSFVISAEEIQAAVEYFTKPSVTVLPDGAAKLLNRAAEHVFFCFFNFLSNNFRLLKTKT